MTASVPARPDDGGGTAVSPRATAVAGPKLPKRVPAAQRPPRSGPSSGIRRAPAGRGRPDLVWRSLKDYQVGRSVARRVLEEARRTGWPGH